MVKSWFWLGIAPETLPEAKLDLDNADIKALLWNPPGSRRFGWNMALPANQIVRGGNYIGRGNYKDCEVLLYDSGLMEFRMPVDTRFCWPQKDEEFRSRPRLNPIPVAELPCSFLKLYSALSSKISITGQFVAGLSFTNIKGFRLPPGRADSPVFDVVLPGMPDILPCKEKTIKLRYWKLNTGFEPEASAFEMVKYVYNCFGMGQESIPYFDRNNQTFNFER